MSALIREYTEYDLEDMLSIWNEVVDDGVAFPQTEPLTPDSAAVFFASQTFSGVAADQATGETLGLYILHPNNIGRCGHIANASYAVKSAVRGRHIGEALVRHSLEQARLCGFAIMQFNAVVKSNHGAIHLYEKLGFVRLGVVPGGFLLKNGTYEDIVLFYHTL